MRRGEAASVVPTVTTLLVFSRVPDFPDFFKIQKMIFFTKVNILGHFTHFLSNYFFPITPVSALISVFFSDLSSISVYFLVGVVLLVMKLAFATVLAAKLVEDRTFNLLMENVVSALTILANNGRQFCCLGNHPPA